MKGTYHAPESAVNNVLRLTLSGVSGRGASLHAPLGRGTRRAPPSVAAGP